MNALFAAAVDIQTFCAARGWQSCVIGGLAVQRWGEPRQTRDVDVTILTGLGGEERFVDPILSHYRARIPDARAFALAHRVLLLETSEGVPLDVSLGGLPYESRILDRSSAYEFEPGVSIRTCSGEDLVVLKVFAGRPQDWLDVEGILVRQGMRLNRLLVLDEVGPLLELKDDAESARQLQTLCAKHPQ